VASRDLPAWAVIIIVSREFLITGLRLIAISRGRTLPAERLGKHKTVWQMVTVVYYLLIKSIGEASWLRLSPTAETVASVIGAVVLSIAVVLTLFSGLSYLAKNRDLVSDS
jgi:CDP-diacylglycerol--glycerol-3-phosphate 3-phosphatidyltransferase